MQDIDDKGIREELDKISRQVDAIMRRVEELYPPETRAPDANPSPTPNPTEDGQDRPA
jgi:hypothetical protein